MRGGEGSALRTRLEHYYFSRRTGIISMSASGRLWRGGHRALIWTFTAVGAFTLGASLGESAAWNESKAGNRRPKIEEKKPK